MSTRVVNIKEEECEIYIDRRSKWGNPYILGRDGDRKQVIEKYRRWILCNPDLLACLSELEGKVLGCHCKPKACHGDILVGLIENMC